MFLLNSRYSLFNVIFNTLYSEVTELFCRVPSIVFFHRFSIFYLSTSVSFHYVKIITNAKQYGVGHMFADHRRLLQHSTAKPRFAHSIPSSAHVQNLIAHRQKVKHMLNQHNNSQHLNKFKAVSVTKPNETTK